ncbi:unnamed protein product [Gongylonema pulchrum]|uniref:Mitochondrial import inner membrane translocase subunit Tim21 n=1 Tax=Gongylonema pulchrum TaxID=637853 RepID=A0A183EW88_9BILA|nr:unnamed protein product [Gongylonema pulchrum]
MAGMSYLLYEEVFSPAGPQAVFSKAMSLIRSDPDCQRLLGNSVVGYGEGRGRIKRIAHHTYQKGSRREGITTAEMEKVDNKWRWRFLIVSTTDLIPETVILIDNR